MPPLTPDTSCVADQTIGVKALVVPEGTKEALQDAWKQWVTEYVEENGDVRCPC